METNKIEEFSRKMTANEIKESAQRLYDKSNWGFPSLTTSEHFRLIALKVNYLELTGKEIELEYNCPA